jgi:hypothetical protein
MQLYKCKTQGLEVFSCRLSPSQNIYFLNLNMSFVTVGINSHNFTLEFLVRIELH